MNQFTRILIVEDMAADADLAKRTIQNALNNCEFRVVETRKDFLQALETFKPDLVLSDYHLPSFDGMTALKLTIEQAPLTPLIIWTGSISEDVAVDCMKAGANNYVLKENIKRLGPAVIHALEERQLMLERKRAEEALQNNEKRFRSLIENGLDNISLLAPDSTLIWESPAAIRMLDYVPDEFVGQNIFTLMHPDDLEWTRDLFTKLIQEPESRQHNTFRLQHSDGTWRWVEAVATNMLNEPSVSAIVVNYRDITERKQAEDALKDLARFPEENPNPILRTTPGGQITYANSASQPLLAEWNSPVGSFLPAKLKELIAEALENNANRFAEASAHDRIYSIMSVPIREAGYVNLYGRDVTEQKQAEEALRESQIKYRNLVETSHELIWSIDADGRITFLNRAAKEIYGYEPEELIGHSFTEILDPQYYHAEALEKFKETLAYADEFQQVETYVRHQDGRQIILSVNSIVIRDEHGNVIGVTGSSHDITVRKQMEETLKEERNLLRTLIDNLPDRIYVMDMQGRKTLSNTTDWKASGGKTMEDVIGKTDFDTYPPELAEEFWQLDKAVLDSGQPIINHEEPGLDAEGNPVLILSTKIPLRDDEGKVMGLVGIGRDITERKQAEERLVIERNLLSIVIDNLPDNIFVKDINSRLIMDNIAHRRLLGATTLEEVVGKTDFDFFPKELAAPYFADEEKIIQSGEAMISREEPVVDQYGNQRWLLTTKVPLHNPQGIITGIVGINRDITERKQAEARINDLLAFNEKILNHSPVGILTYKLTGECVFANENAALIVGTEVEQLEAQNFRTIEAWKKSGLYDLVEKAITTQAPVTDDIHHVSTFGKDIWMTVHCVTFKSKDEAHVLLSISDITKRKRIETERQALLEIMQGLTNTKDLQELLKLIHHSIDRVIYARNFFVVLYQQNSGLFEEIYSVDQYDPPAPPAKLEKSITSYVFRSGEPLLLTQARFDELAAGGEVALVGTNSASWLGVPLKTSGGTIGVIAVQDYENLDRYSVHDKDFLASIASQVALAIERKQAEDALRKSEERYHSLFENMIDGYAHCQILFENGQPQDFIYLDVNPAFESLTGLRDVVGKKVSEVIPGIRESNPELLDIYGRVASTRQPEQFETYLPNLRSGTSLAISVYSPEKDHFVAVVENITERKQAEEELRRSHSLLYATLESTADGILVVGPNGTVSNFNRKFLELWRIPYSLAAQKDDRILLEYILNQLKDPSAFISKVTELYQSPEAISLDELEFHDGRVFERFSQPQKLGDAIAGRVWSFRDITERKQAEQSLHESEQRYRALFEDLPIAIWEEDFSEVKKYLDSLKEQGLTDFRAYFASHPNLTIECANRIRILNANNAALHMYRAEDKEDLIRGTVQELTKGELEHIHEDFIAVAEGRISHSWEGADTTLAGEPIEISLSWSVVPGYEENYSKIIVTTTDITERKRAETALMESNTQFRTLFEASPDAIMLIDPRNDWPILDCNTAACLMNGYTRDELVGQPIDILNENPAIPDERAEYLERIRKAGILRLETFHRRKDGTVFPIDVSTSLITLGGDDVILGIDRDITERKRAEQALLKREGQLEEAQRLGHIGSWEWDIRVNVTTWSAEMYRLYDRDRQLPACNFEEFIAYIHPDDRERVMQIIQQTFQTHLPCNFDYRITIAEGETRWLHGRGEMVMDDTGQALRMQGIAQDVTQRKQSEMETHRHVAELEALYENGLAVGRLLEPQEIGERIIETFARHLSWHHVTIRLKHTESDELKLIAFNQPGLSDEEKTEIERHFNAMISRVGQGMSGWVMNSGLPLRTGDVHAHPQYIDTHAGIQSGLYMPLKVGERVIGVISVESEVSDAFTEQDERLLATLASQAAIAFENAHLYQTIEEELSERKRAEEALRASETHYRELADSITDVLFELDQNLHYTHWNKASEALTGIPATEAMGKSMHEIFGESEEQIRIGQIYEGVLRNRQPRTFETTMVLNGQQRSFEINAYPSTRGVSVVSTDVTDRKKTESIMQKRFELMEYSAHHTLNEVMQKTTDEVSELTGSSIGFFHFMEEDQITLGMQTWSTNVLRLFNVPLREGTHLPLDQAEVWAEAVRQRRPLIQNDYESLAIKKGLPQGHVPILREMVIPIIRNERIMAVMGIGDKPLDYTQYDLEIAARLADYAWDITERKQMRDALEDERNQLAKRVEERTSDLSRANSNLARALRVKDEFLANMSHELRTPLNAILGLSESLGEQIAGPLNDKQQKYITTISESGHHLLALINDILDLAKIEAGQITLDINKVDIRSVCQASLRMIKQLAQKKNQEVMLKIDDGLGLMWADERRLKQMIVNLLGNAVKFTPENGKLGVEVHGDQDANKVTITVWDNGIGIKDDDLARLFQPFVQLDSGLARETTGTGLGLALVAQMARLHGGSVNATSQTDTGSRFSIILPWEPALAIDTASRLKVTAKFRAIKPNETNKPTILLVEDTKEVVMMLKDYLELAGYKVVTAQDGVDAIVQAKLARPDLILMDIQMPRMDGLETTRRLRSEADFRYTPIIALTALAMPRDRERCLEAGMDEYISKPVNLKALVKIIQSCLFNDQEVKSR